MTQNTSPAVMAQRREPPDALDFFPTPPWATRALTECVLPMMLGVSDLSESTCWEPAAGEGHMAEVLREFFYKVWATDIHDYGRGDELYDFTGAGLIQNPPPIAGRVDWIITNPPFNAAADFARRALELGSGNVALLVRLAWLEGETRFRTLFLPCPPAAVAIFSERVPMAKGRWDPDGSTATAYAWVIWRAGHRRGTDLVWIPPGQRQCRTRPDDIPRFGSRAYGPHLPLVDDEAGP